MSHQCVCVGLYRMSGSGSSALSPKEQAEQEDRKLLRENDQKIQEIMQLLDDGNTHTIAKQKVKDAKNKITIKDGSHRQSVFHPYKGKRTPISQEASNYLALGDALELMLTTSQHSADLQKALTVCCKKRVDVLERLLRRGGT
jgi:hypothetical protein